MTEYGHNFKMSDLIFEHDSRPICNMYLHIIKLDCDNDICLTGDQ